MEDLPAVLVRLSGFLDRPILSHEMPSRAEVAGVDGRWVRRHSDWRRKVNRRHMRLFQAVDGEMLATLGYEPCGADTAIAAEEADRVRGGLRAADDALAGQSNPIQR